MGDFSRDTFRLTNILHQVLTGTEVSNARHYVGVRQQQGKPLLDADRNELEDIRRYESQLSLGRFVGNGVPEGSDGFRIGPVTEENDLAISVGLAMVEGMLVYNQHANLTYRDQAAVLGEAPEPLAPPDTGTRIDLVYLDVWEEEVEATGPGRSDGRLINPAIGVETATRLERRWLVRVAPGAESLAGITREEGHAYMALATLRRVETQPLIRPSRIIDRRRTNINVSRHLKIPVRVQHGSLIIDSDSVAEMLRTLRSLLFSRIESDRLFVDDTDSLKRMALGIAAQYVIQVCATGTMQARTENLTREGALRVLEELHAAQRGLTDALEEHGEPAGGDRDAFVDDYRSRLGDLDAAIAQDDLVNTYQAQQGINAWLALQTDDLPEGDLKIEYVSVDPDEPLEAGTAYTFTIRVTSGVTADDSTEEVIDIRASLSTALWSVTPDLASVTVANDGGTATATFTVTPNSGNSDAHFEVIAEAHRNPTEVQSTHPGLDLTIGAPAPVGAVLSYVAGALNEDDQLEITEEQISRAFGFEVGFGLSNRTDEDLTYRLEWHLELAEGVDEADWSPTSDNPGSNTFDIPANAIEEHDLAIQGPPGAAGTLGTMHVTLTHRGPNPDSLEELTGDDRETVSVDFIIVPNTE